MMIKKIFILTLLILMICACSKKPDCMIADSVQEIENEALNEKNLRLYLRASGFGEKERFYELFKGTPSFDECGVATVNTLSQVHVDISLGAPEKVIIKNNQIKIEYMINDDSPALRNVIIILD